MKLTCDQKYTFTYYLNYLKLNNGSYTVIELLELILDESPSEKVIQEELRRLTSLINHPSDTLDSQKADARWMLGLCHDHGIGTAKNVGVAVTFYRAAADQGQVLAQNVMGYIYYGSKVRYWLYQDPNPILARQYFEQAAAQNNYFSAVLNLANCYEMGDIVPKDYKRAKELFREAALLFQKQERELTLLGRELLGVGWAPDALQTSANNLLLMVNGYVEDPEFIKMKNEYKIKAKRLQEFRDTSKAMDSKDIKHAAEFHRQKAIAGDARSLYQLGYCYENSLGVPADMDRAVLLYQKAAEQNDDAAISKVDLINQLHTGEESFPVLKDACKYYQNELSQDEDDAYYYSILGFCHQLGLGTPQDLPKACEFYSKAIDKGMSCHWDLFICYSSLHEPGSEPKDIKALSENLNHYTLHNFESYLCLAYLNEMGGPGLEKNYDKAVEYYKKVLDSLDEILPCFQAASEKKWEMEEATPEKSDLGYAKNKVLFFSPFKALKKEIQEGLDASSTSFPPKIISLCAEYAFEYDLILTPSKKTWRNLWGLI